MTFLPIVEREMRVASRRRGTYWRRFVAAALALSIGMWILVADRYNNPNQMGQELFIGLSVLIFIGALAAGTQVTADCLSEEKREGTLGLLFLTDLKGYDVVFGKLAATSVALFYDLLATVPVLAIPMLLGGVSKGEVGRVVVVELNLLFLSVSTGIFASAVSKTSLQSSMRSISILILLVTAVPIIVFATAINNGPNLEHLLVLCPATGCFSAFTGNSLPALKAFWINAAITQAFSWVFLALACRIVPRCWQDAAVKTARSRRTHGAGRTAAWTARAADLDQNPYLWRACRGNQSLLGWSGLAVIAVLWGWAQSSQVGRIDTDLNFMAIVFAHLLLKLWLSAEACRPFNDDRRAGAMELLLSTPLTAAQIVRGQHLALFKLFLTPVVAILGVDCIFFYMAPQLERGTIPFYLITIGFLIADLYTLAWVGPWLALKTRSSNAAARGAISRVVVIPALIPTALGMMLSGQEGGSLDLFLTVWVATGLVADVFFCVIAREGLHTRFRELVYAR